MVAKKKSKKMDETIKKIFGRKHQEEDDETQVSYDLYSVWSDISI